jgi:hypothetical protein
MAGKGLTSQRHRTTLIAVDTNQEDVAHEEADRKTKLDR